MSYFKYTDCIIDGVFYILFFSYIFVNFFNSIMIIVVFVVVVVFVVGVFDFSYRF